MKRFSKIIINALIVALLAVTCLGLVSCGKKDIKTVGLTLSLYDYEEDVTFAESDVEISIDLYRHLAPKTVDKMVSYIEDGYYDGAIFYQMMLGGKVVPQIMVGDLKLVDGQIVQNDVKPMIEGEFENGGTLGSDLVNKKGSVGLWRTWSAYDEKNGDGFKTSVACDTGRATWFMPTKTYSQYDKYFCVFGMLDLEDESTTTGLNGIINAFGDEGNYDNYVIYYTGEYDEDKPNENYGLTFNCVREADFDSDEILDLFVAKDGPEDYEYACYNHYTIQVPVNASGEICAFIKSAKMA